MSLWEGKNSKKKFSPKRRNILRKLSCECGYSSQFPWWKWAERADVWQLGGLHSCNPKRSNRFLFLMVIFGESNPTHQLKSSLSYQMLCLIDQTAFMFPFVFQKLNNCSRKLEKRVTRENPLPSCEGTRYSVTSFLSQDIPCVEVSALLPRY